MKITDKKRLVKLVSYMTMGDGCLYIPPDCNNAKFILNMVEKNEDFVDLCRDILENITSTRKYFVEKKGTRQNQYRLETRNLPFFTKIRDRIYTMKYKGIDPHALKMLDWESLAILYMCDGSFVSYLDKNKSQKNPSYNVTLNLKRLSYGDLFILKKALKEKLDLEWNINRQNKYFYLRLRMKDLDKFMENIAPYITDSFNYKVKDNFRIVSPSKIGGEIVQTV